MSNFAELLSENVSPEGFHWDKDAITEGGHAISVQSTARLSLCLVHAYTSTHIRKKEEEANIKKFAISAQFGFQDPFSMT